MKLIALLALGTLAGPSIHALSAGDGACTAQKTAACTTAGGKTIVQTASEAGGFRTLVAALGAANLAGALEGEGPFTVFAPSDEAFAKLPKGTLEHLLDPKNRQELTELLTYHVVAARLPATAVVELPGAESLNGQRLTIHVDEDGVRVVGAKVVKTDITCSNGVIHVLDTVLMPSRQNLVELAGSAGTFGTLLAAAQAAGLADTLATGGPFTLLAPTDEAFAKIPKETLAALLEPDQRERLAAILKAHVIPGRVFADQVVSSTRVQALSGDELAIQVAKGEVRIGGAKVLETDLQARNGVVHVIDTVLLPH